MQVNAAGTALGRQADSGKNLLLVAVYSAGGQQAEDVHGAACRHGLVDGAGDRPRLLSKLPSLMAWSIRVMFW